MKKAGKPPVPQGGSNGTSDSLDLDRIKKQYDGLARRFNQMKDKNVSSAPGQVDNILNQLNQNPPQSFSSKGKSSSHNLNPAQAANRQTVAADLVEEANYENEDNSSSLCNEPKRQMIDGAQKLLE